MNSEELSVVIDHTTGNVIVLNKKDISSTEKWLAKNGYSEDDCGIWAGINVLI